MTRPTFRRLSGTLTVLAGVWSCSGTDTAGAVPTLGGPAEALETPPGAAAAEPATPAGGVVSDPVAAACGAGSFAAPLQMLNQFELQNTIADLFGEVSPELSVPRGARGLYRGGLLIDQLPTRWEETAWEIAAEVTADVSALTGCEAANQTAACAQTFIQGFAAKAFRRPVSAPELDKLMLLFQDGQAEGFSAGIEMVIAAALQHPLFVYRAETGIVGSAPGEPGLRRLTGYEVAARLSYSLWATLPDDALFAAAASGELNAPAGIRVQAERLLLDPRATPMFADFVGQWLFLDHLGSVPKDGELFPDYTAETSSLLKQELQRFVQDLFQNSGDFNALFTADYGFLNQQLAQFYSVEGVSGDALEKTVMPPQAQRAGLLTFAGLLSVEGNIQGVSLAGSKRSSPIGRGRFVRERLACETLPPALAGATDLPEVQPLIESLNAEYGQADDVPPRAFFEKVTSEVAVCSGCHAYLEPLGFALERFGADGLPRENDIDGTPAIQTGSYAALGTGSPALTGELQSPGELGARLAASETVKNCFTSHLLQYGLGRGFEGPDVACLGSAPTDTGSRKLKDLYLELAASDLYRVRKFD